MLDRGAQPESDEEASRSRTATPSTRSNPPTASPGRASWIFSAKVVLHLGVAIDPDLVAVIGALIGVLHRFDEPVGIAHVPQQPDTDPAR